METMRKIKCLTMPELNSYFNTTSPHSRNDESYGKYMSYYEAGHALICILNPSISELISVKMSCIHGDRANKLFTFPDLSLTISKKQIENALIQSQAGRAATELLFGKNVHHQTGLEAAFSVGQALIKARVSEDRDITSDLDQARKKAIKILRKHKDTLINIADILYYEGRITAQQIHNEINSQKKPSSSDDYTHQMPK